jgi:hypothetical protein
VVAQTVKVDEDRPVGPIGGEPVLVEQAHAVAASEPSITVIDGAGEWIAHVSYANELTVPALTGAWTLDKVSNLSEHLSPLFNS